MDIKFFTYEQFHGKTDIGSTRLRVHNLIKYWPEADLYKYGQKPDVLIFQKVYLTIDYKFPENFPGLKILDVCDPDWHDTPDIFIKETLDAMDAVVTPTKALTDKLQMMTDTPVRIIKDRFDIAEFPEPKVHSGPATKAVWFGYAHNAETIKFAVPSLAKRDLDLLVISNNDPHAWRWVGEAYQTKYQYKKYIHPPYELIQQADICLFPTGTRPQDRFKSENKTVISELCGIPVVKNSDELDALLDPDARNKHVEETYAKLKKEYNVKKSIAEYKELIDEIRNKRR